MRRRRQLIGVTLVLAVLAAGCGGGGDSSKKAEAAKKDPLATYRSTVGKICTDQLAAMHKSIGDVTPSSPKSAQDAAFVTIGNGFLHEVELVKAVKAPASIAPDVEAWLASLTVAANKTKTQGRKLLTPGRTPAYADADAKAKALGIPKCASGGS